MFRIRSHPGHRSPKPGRRDRGSQAIEFAGLFPLLLLLVVIALEAFVSFTAIERIDVAARAGARVAGPQGPGAAEAAARDSLPGWLDDAKIRSGYTDEGVYTEISVEGPFMWKNSPIHIPLSRKVDMPLL